MHNTNIHIVHVHLLTTRGGHLTAVKILVVSC